MVVVIDPAAYARRQVRDQLAPLGCAVVELTGEEDPEALSEALARARVVVVEPAPHGSRAGAWLRRLRAIHPGAALVVCSALTTRAAVLTYRGAGAVDVVAKPWRPERLQAAVAAALARAGATGRPTPTSGGGSGPGPALGRGRRPAAEGEGTGTAGRPGGRGSLVDQSDPVPSRLAAGHRGGRLG
ncbi:response regulator [Thermaerobacter composti]|uniref:Stage 0 sporulation protein A homolog n=1 Tax=Thermaerobacter composti TaxID=554949 RepID=A0ABZ0QR50_9FIRM|nr:response regulator [Thermaerobacter composti]WPD19977.1 response regulator [Thermaerobacter composti]